MNEIQTFKFNDRPVRVMQDKHSDSSSIARRQKKPSGGTEGDED